MSEQTSKALLSQIQKELAANLSGDRYKHTAGVASTAKAMAIKYEADAFKAELAGWLHDIAKEFEPTILLQEAERYGIALNEIERANPHLLHARVGAKLAQEKYQINDHAVLEAIARHTLGHPNMNLLEQILFVADATEPIRATEWAEPIRAELNKNGLAAAIIVCCKNTIAEVMHKKRLLHPLTVQTYNFYLQTTVLNQP
jgi:predicted HD superfamily hydrolase involved in NAD metabolism